VVRMFAITGGFHRYFSHRSYKTGRVFQFLMAFLGQTSAQKGVLWWAAIHRHHHLHSDTEHDVHSPRHTGFLFSHVGWIFSPQKNTADYSTIKDFTRYPELVWLDRFSHAPAVLLGVACFLLAGWQGLFVGFFLSTVILYHGTFAINSLAHVVGKQRYVTGDDSRNNWWLAIITLGEGWHNNHHAYQSSTRQGFRWYEIDITFYVLKALSWVGVVRDLRAPPAEVVMGEQRLGKKVLEKVAHELALSFPIDRISEEVRDAWAHRPAMPTLDELRERARQKRQQAAARLADVHLPSLPSLDDLKARANEMYADSPSLDDIATRAHDILLEAVSTRLFDDTELAAGS
ncbi:MAG: fatty acid desaturase, partial [Gemmatimonadota bacterium]